MVVVAGLDAVSVYDCKLAGMSVMRPRLNC